MTTGVFSAAFISNLNSGGSGVAIFSGNTIHGGDASHYYKMSSSTPPLQNSVFGPIASFRLKLDGHIILNERAFELSGHIEGQPQLQIKIALNKLDDLIEA